MKSIKIQIQLKQKSNTPNIVNQILKKQPISLSPSKKKQKAHRKPNTHTQKTPSNDETLPRPIVTQQSSPPLKKTPQP